MNRADMWRKRREAESPHMTSKSWIPVANPPPADTAIVDLLTSRSGELTRVVLSDGRHLDVFDSRCGYDMGDDYAHVMSAIDLDGPDGAVVFFTTDNVDAVFDGEGTSLYLTAESLRQPGDVTRFVGLQPLETDSEIIELDDTSLGFIDLHNECSLVSMAITVLEPADQQLHVAFVKLLGTRVGDSFTLIFGGLSRLTMKQLPEGSTTEPSQFHGMDYLSRDNFFTVRTGSLSTSFRAASMTFQAG